MSIGLKLQDRYGLRIDKDFSQMSSLAVNWVEEFLADRAHRTGRKMKILEYGSGMSTVLFSKLFPDYEITSIEGNKEWYEKIGKLLEDNVDHRFIEHSPNWRIRNIEIKKEYLDPLREKKSWDLILNDGCIRETIGDYIMENIDRLLKPGGIYLRHDYEMAITGKWIQTGYKKPGYDEFTAKNDGYELITVTGNGMWGYKAEMGGIWRKEI